jgi:hypothetical protein
MGVPSCLLVGPLGDPDTLEADGEPGKIHHLEHQFETTMAFAEQVADRSALVAE